MRRIGKGLTSGEKRQMKSGGSRTKEGDAAGRRKQPNVLLSGNCFYCLGDRGSVHGVLPDMVVLYVTEKANTLQEAFEEFEQFENDLGEKMRLNMIVGVHTRAYYESIK